MSLRATFQRLARMGPAYFPSGTRQVRRYGWRWTVPVTLMVGVAAAAAGVAATVVVATGALDGEWYDFRDLGFATQELRARLDDSFDPWVSYLAIAAIGAAGIAGVVTFSMIVLGWVERRLLARIQIRQGPNRVGPFGLFQTLADALKLMQKETVVPRGADRFLYFLPPMLVFVPLLLVWGPVPWAPGMSYADLNVGVLYIIAAGSLATLAIFIAGWSSNNHYALLGAMRTIAMMISYEIPQSIALLAVVVVAGSMNLGDIVAWQSDHNLWMALLMPAGVFAFFFSATAEVNRTPNDIAEAESEIVAGYHTEYSGMKFGLMFAVELGNALVVGALVTTLYLGGWSLFGLEEWIPPYLIFTTKALLMYFVFIWLRGTLPRLRLDQLMTFAWKFLIPVTVVNVLVIAVEVTIVQRWDVEGIVSLGLITLVNIATAVALLRLWSRVAGYHPDREPALPPTMTTTVGGLEAARAMAQGAGRARA